MARWQMTCNRLQQPCGCVTWLEWDHDQDAWVAKAHLCYKHEHGAG